MKTSKDKRQKIIDTAIKLFVKNGVHHTSIQALAKKAGVATGSIYTYFKSKDELVVIIFQELMAEGAEVVPKDYDASQSVKERFYCLLNNKIRYHIDNPERFRFMRICSYEPVIMRLIKMTSHENKPMVAVIKAGQAEKLLKDIPIHDLFYQLFGGVGALLEWQLFNQKNITDSDINNMIDMAWDAIRR